jgi:hypothetical protein
MFGSNSNFTKIKYMALAIVAECDTVTFTLVLLKGCERPSLPRHMICASTIKYPTCTTRSVTLQNKLGFCFRYPSLVGSSQVSNKALGHPHTSLWFLEVWPNMQGSNFTNLISHKYISIIKIVIWHMRNMRNISIRIRDIVSGLHPLFLFLLDISLHTRRVKAVATEQMNQTLCSSMSLPK